MSVLVFLFVTASTLTILSSGENAPICQGKKSSNRNPIAQFVRIKSEYCKQSLIGLMLVVELVIRLCALDKP